MPDSRATRNLLVLPRLLRRAGVPVDANRARLFLRAVAEIDLARADDVRAAARATLVSHPADRARFEETFDLFWSLLRGGRLPSDTADVRARRRDAVADVTVPAEGATRAMRRRAIVRLIASAEEVLRTRDFAAMTAEERAAAARFLERLAWSPGLRPSRRFRPAEDGSRYDARATLRRSLRTFGEPAVLLRRAPRPKRRPLVLLCDVSGSMEAYTRLLLHLTHALAQGWGRVEAFTFGTRLTRITRALRHRRADVAVARVARAVEDWSGGTRIGDSLREFNRRWSRRVLGRGPVVLLCSDGWERGDPRVLAEETERLQRASYRLIWLNPLSGTSGYAPESAGARVLAARVDDHLAANTLEGLEAVAALLASTPRARPARHQVAATR